jgi:hypothetical protein
MPRAHARLVLVAAFVGVTAATACYTDPNKQLDQLQETLDLTATLNELGARTSEMQFAIDSLRGVLVRQDSTIAKLANLAGVPYVH